MKGLARSNIEQGPETQSYRSTVVNLAPCTRWYHDFYGDSGVWCQILSQCYGSFEYTGPGEMRFQLDEEKQEEKMNG